MSQSTSHPDSGRRQANI